MRHFRSIFYLVLLLVVVSLACNFGSGGDEPTAVPEATTAPTDVAVSPTEPPAAPTLAPTDAPVQPTEPPATKPALPTSAPPPTDVPVAQAPFELVSTPYSHPDGIFEIYPPVGWELEEKTAGATFTEPNGGSGFINVEVTNTSYQIDGASFEQFVDARDENLFGKFDGYEVINRQVDTDTGVARITKRLNFSGEPQVVFTLYDQHSEIIFSLDFWASADLAAPYRDKYEEIIDSASVDSAQAAAVVDVYYWIYTFTGPNDLFEIDVPLSWKYETTSGDFAVVDTFYSPDNHGIVQNIAYDDGEAINNSQAGAFALALLKEYYADDIRITDDQVQPDGSERLTWNSPSGDYSGISFFESRGTTFLLFSVLWDNPYEVDYFDTLDYIISTYDVP
ncbi:MAG: hypothetical protein WAM60_18805 [Candidatus Promineifilaceae bacterium]